ncbi:hypothetical protein JXL21_08035 [Candidatus Bathyarchaeota archaeon]|nr:hypothetical protein [Candidatus Bathyarchaeota archaeon]
MSPQPPDGCLADALSRIENGSKILLIQLPGNNAPHLTQTNLHLCACQLESLLGLPERTFTDKVSDKDHIIFSRLQRGATLLDRITMNVLEECLGKTGAALVNTIASEGDSPLNYNRVIHALSGSMGSGVDLIKRAIAKSLYNELRSNPGALTDEQP